MLFINKRFLITPPVLKNRNYYFALLVIVVVYYLAGKVGLSLALLHPNVSPVWPPTGIALAAFILFGSKIFPSILLGSFLVNITTTGILVTSLGISIGNTFEGMLGAYLIRKYIGTQYIFNRPINILKFLMYAGVISTLVSAVTGVTVLSLYNNLFFHNYSIMFFTWWLGNIGGALTVGALIYLYINRSDFSFNKSKIIELTTVSLLFIILNFLIFFYNIPYPLAFISVPFLVWIALRFSLKETSAGILILSLIAILGTLNGTGPFIHEDANQSLLMIQVFILIVFVTVMPLASSVNQKRDLNDKLEKKDFYFNQLFEISNDAIFTLGKENEIVFANPAAERVFGYSHNELIGKKIEIIIPDFSKRFISPEDIQQDKKNNWIQSEAAGVKKNGAKIIMEISRGFIKNGEINYNIFLKDITVRKIFEDELLKNKTEIDHFFDIASIGLNWIDPQRRTIIKANETELNLLGNSSKDYIGKNFSDFFYYEEDAEEFFNELNKNESLKNFKTVLKHKNGSLKTVLINANIYRQDEKATYARCFTRDITEQVQIEETNSFLAAIVESSHDAIIGKSTEYKIISWNRGAEIIYGYSPEEIIGKPVSVIVPEWRKDETRRFNENMIKGFEVNQYETERVKKDGTVINVSLTISPIRDSKGKVIGASAIERDITDKIKSNNQLQASLKEKELLLKEIHHRVKNNLQIISSLLSLQSQYIIDPNTIEIFNESKNRVRTMALVHEKLYQSEDLLKINFPSYVSDLITSLSNVYSYKFSNIIIEKEIEEINVTVDDIINLGLIINELITNSFKHGFIENSRVSINVQFFKEGDKNILIVKDNGKGLPENFDINNINSLGLNLVMALSDQLNAELEFKTDGGAEFKIIIPIKE